MKRVLSLLLVCVLAVVLFSACGNDSGTVTIDKTELEMQVGDSHTFTITESDTQLSLDLFTWKSTNESVAMVIAGKVVALKDGESVIVATKDNHILSCNVKVSNGAETTSLKAIITKQTTTKTTKLKTTAKPTTTTTTKATTTKVTECNHQYATQTKYKCTLCGKVDRSLTYPYFTEWIRKNGTYKENDGWWIEYIAQEGEYKESYHLVYHPENQSVSCMIYINPKYIPNGDTWKLAVSIAFDELGRGVYISTFGDYMSGYQYLRFIGTLSIQQYTKTTALTYYESVSDCGMKVGNEELQAARNGINRVLVVMADLLRGRFGNTTDSGLTLADLGFSSFEA